MSAARSQQRLVVVDAVRALALFGVLVMNLRSMSGLESLSLEAQAALQGGFDRVLDAVLKVVLDEKSLSAFSFLFGLSFSLLLERKAGQGGFLALYARRLLALAGFGLLNVAFFYWGDILLTYAALGGLLLPACRLPQRMLLALAAALLFGAPLVLALAGAVAGPPVQTAADARALAGFGSDNYLDAVRAGFMRYWGVAGSDRLIDSWDSLNILGLFLLGLWTGRAHLPHRLDDHRRLLRRVAGIGVPLGLAGGVAWVWLPPSSPWSTVMLAHAPVLALGYLAAAALLLRRPALAPLRDILAAGGRLALTNYLLYGLVGQLIFYGWALGLIGRVDVTGVLVISLLVFILLQLASRAWLRRYRMGPAEWLWRCLTYLRMQPLRREPAGEIRSHG